MMFFNFEFKWHLILNFPTVFLIQNLAEPTISENNIETCLIGKGSRKKRRKKKHTYMAEP